MHIQKIAEVLCLLILNFSLIECQNNSSELDNFENRSDQGDEELNKIINDFILQHSGSGNETSNNLDTWEAPEEMQKNLVYYLSGHDDEDRPIWIAEWGKWDAKKYIERGVESEEYKNYERYGDQQILRMMQSLQLKPENSAKELIFIIDMEEYPLEQLASSGSLIFFLRKAGTWKLFSRSLRQGYIVNTNYVAESLLNLFRPVLGEVVAQFEVYGTNKEKWIPKLLKQIPRSELPAWYGGAKNFRPLKVYG